MNTNLGTIPLEIYTDYISEFTNQEWSSDMLSISTLSYGLETFVYHYGDGYDNGNTLGCGYSGTNGDAYGLGSIGHSHGYGFGFGEGDGYANRRRMG